MIEAFVVSLVVGVVEIGPGQCQVELLNPDGSINTSVVGCEWIVPEYNEYQEFPS